MEGSILLLVKTHTVYGVDVLCAKDGSFVPAHTGGQLSASVRKLVSETLIKRQFLQGRRYGPWSWPGLASNPGLQEGSEHFLSTNFVRMGRLRRREINQQLPGGEGLDKLLNLSSFPLAHLQSLSPGVVPRVQGDRNCEGTWELGAGSSPKSALPALPLAERPAALSAKKASLDCPQGETHLC